MLSGSILIILNNNEPILNSTLAASIVQDTYAGETGKVEGGKEESTGGYFYRFLYCALRLEILTFLSTSISIAKHQHAHTYQKRPYVYIHTYNI